MAPNLGKKKRDQNTTKMEDLEEAYYAASNKEKNSFAVPRVQKNDEKKGRSEKVAAKAKNKARKEKKMMLGEESSGNVEE